MPGIFDGVNGDCQEFGHIHFYQVQGKAHVKLNVEAFETRETESSDNDCHEGKSVLSYSPFPAEVYEVAPEQFVLVFEPNFDHENTFVSPDLEPLRKPPKIA